MALQITIQISDTDEKVLKNDLLDIQEWVNGAVTGKIDNCFGRLRGEWIQRLMDDPSFTQSIPSDKDGFVNMVTSLPEYKNRAQRDAESQAPAPAVEPAV